MGGVMDRSAILAAARQAIVGDRAATHGAAEASFAAIAGGWNWWLEIRRGGALTPVDVGAMMVIFKLARAAANSGHADNWIDAVGYAACTGEMALAGGQPAAPPVAHGPTDRADAAQATGFEAVDANLGPATLPPWVAVVAQAVSRAPAVVGASAKPKPGSRRVARLTSQTRWTAERCAQVAQMVRDGASNAEIAAAFGATVKAVVNLVYRLRRTGGLPLLATMPQDVVPVLEPAAAPEPAVGSERASGSGAAAMVWDAPKTAALLEMMAAGTSHAAIGRALGVSTKAVYNKIYKMRAAASGSGTGSTAGVVVTARGAPAPVPAAKAVPAAAPERIVAPPPAEFWTPARDLDLVERQARGEGLVDIAEGCGIDLRQCRERFRELSAGFRDDRDRLPIEAMPKMLAVLRTQAEVAHG